MKFHFDRSQADEYAEKVKELKNEGDEDFQTRITKEGFLILTGRDRIMGLLKLKEDETQDAG
jgi:hypothetical protein